MKYFLLILLVAALSWIISIAWMNRRKSACDNCGSHSGGSDSGGGNSCGGFSSPSCGSSDGGCSGGDGDGGGD